MRFTTEPFAPRSLPNLSGIIAYQIRAGSNQWDGPGLAAPRTQDAFSYSRRDAEASVCIRLLSYASNRCSGGERDASTGRKYHTALWLSMKLHLRSHLHRCIYNVERSSEDGATVPICKKRHMANLFGCRCPSRRPA